MTLLDVFKGNAFGVVSLTNAIDKMPFQPKRLGELGIFKKKPVTTTTIAIEERHGVLALIPTAARGSMPTTDRTRNRKIRTFSIPHIPKNDSVWADEVQNVRAFGEDSVLETVTKVLNDKLEVLRMDHEVTHEYHRVGAISGILLDADGTTEIYDWFEEFGITETVVVFDFDTDTFNVKGAATEVLRAMETALGADTYSRIHAICGDDFFDALVNHPTVAAAYDRWMEGRFFREQQFRTGFEYAGISWENYRGGIGDLTFIPTGTCRFVPAGTRDTFEEIYGPADFVETVNTMGKPVYVKQEPMRFDKGIEIHTQSNALILCKRPAVLIKGTYTPAT